MRAVVIGLVAALAAAHGAVASSAQATGPWQKIATLRGSGARVVTVKLPPGPVVFVATNRGSSNFVVQLSGPEGKDLLVNEIGPFQGASVRDGSAAGRHRVAVDSDGAWVIQVLRPTTSGLKSLPASFSGKGSTVIRVKSRDDTEMVVTATHAGESNFVVYLVGYGSLTGRTLVFNEIGRYKGQELVDVPKGTMLLWVTADGTWSVRFAR